VVVQKAKDSYLNHTKAMDRHKADKNLCPFLFLFCSSSLAKAEQKMI
jgi:hypothetical protein